MANEHGDPMIMMYTIFDSKAEAYMNPFFAPTRGVAHRMFEQAVRNEKSDFARHAEDYSMWEIGFFNPKTGDLIPENLVCVALAHEVKAKQDNEKKEEIEV